VAAAKRSLSQNFLVDPNLQRKIVDALEAEPDDLVVEIGPGHGELSRHLVGEVGHLLLVEKDDDLAADLAEKWGEREDVSVLHADALEVDLEEAVARCSRSTTGHDGAPYRVISNVPYAITSPLTFRILDLRPPPRRVVLTVQKEVGERMAADPGSGDYGSLSVGVQIRARPRVAFGVSRHAFRPTPEVESVTVVLEPRPDRPGPEAERAFLTEIRLFPEEVAPYTHLAVLYSLVGDTDRAGAVLRRLVEVQPTPHAYAEAVKAWRALGNEVAASRLLREGRGLHPDDAELRQLQPPS